MITKSWRLLVLLIFVQLGCAAFFIYDAIADLFETGSISVVYSGPEILASLSLLAAIALEQDILKSFRAHEKKSKRNLEVAKGRIDDVLKAYYQEWGLTSAEADVAGLAIKGFSIAEISDFRKSQEGTVKTQLTAIYRKAGITGRNQLGAILIEDLMGFQASSLA